METGHAWTAADALLGILGKHLSAPRIDLDSRFHGLGGDSLVAIRVVNEARAMGIPITLRDLLVKQTVRGLLSLPKVSERHDAERADIEPFALLDKEDRAVVPDGVADALPASALQVGMLYLCEIAGDPLLYHVMTGWEVCAPFDADRFRDAFARLVARHSALRTSFDFDTFSVPAQVVWRDPEPSLTVVETDDSGKAEALVDDWCADAVDVTADWRSPRLFRCHVVATPESFRVALAAHHAVLDGWSLSRLTVELMTAYAGEELPPIPATVQHDFIAAERSALADSASERHWMAHADVPPLLLPDGPGVVPNAAQRLELPLDAGLVAALRGVARTLGAPLKSVFLAAHARALATWTGRETDVVTGVVFNTRPESPGSDLAVGLFLNTLPVRFPSLDGTWSDLVRAAAEAEANGVPHRAYPQAKLVERLGRAPFDVTFNFMNFHAYGELDRLDLATRAWWRRGKPSFPFHVNVELSGAAGQVRVGFDSTLLAKESAQSYMDILGRALDAVAVNPVSPAAPRDRGNR
ncbi:condensation domain-containing protein [Actinocrispum wychmicini]|uniref:Phosphopantetheine binding protein n=1 Tax=Actinocrispum wychmicini TaxID=1213861 RepID=A0A4R2JBJ3_9PSEU|nr:condensation domain-containing protein [Actinocrispum wychmicini]TCO55747.1 phosphopantetheine binding protein [Actinocrispum wychmicini]